MALRRWMNQCYFWLEACDFQLSDPSSLKQKMSVITELSSHWLSAAGEGEAAAVWLSYDRRQKERMLSVILCHPHTRTSSVPMHTLCSLLRLSCLYGSRWAGCCEEPHETLENDRTRSCSSNNQHPLSHAVDEMLTLMMEKNRSCSEMS